MAARPADDPLPEPAGARVASWAARVRPGWLAALVALVAVAVYANSLSGEFVWCDTYLVADNPAVHSLSRLPDLFGGAWGESLPDEDLRARNQGYYRPVALASYSLNRALGGPGAFGFRLVNVLLFAIASALAFLLLRRVTGSPLAALVGALLFAAHPVHTEVVNVTCYRTTLLSGLFVFAALVLSLRALHDGGRAAFAGALLAFVAGALSKEEAFVLPGLVLFYTLLWRRGLPSGRRAVALNASLFALTLVVVALRSRFVQPFVLDFCPECGPTERALTMMHVFWLDVRLLLVPHPLTSFYDWSLVPPAFEPDRWQIWAGLALLLAALLWLHQLVRRDRRAEAFLLGGFGLTLLPYAQLVPIFDIAGERFLFTPSLFALGLLAAYAARGLRGHVRWLAVPILVGLAAVFVAWAGLTVRRNAEWHDDRSILRAAVADHPQSTSAWLGLATLVEREEGCDAALPYYDAAAETAPWLAEPVERALVCFEQRERLGEAAPWLVRYRASGAPPTELIERFDRARE